MTIHSSIELYPFRQVLDGIPRIGFDIHLSPFPGSLNAILEQIKDPYPYDYLMGVTGAAFRRLWNRDDGGNIDILKFGEKPFRLVFDAVGYSWRKVSLGKLPLIEAMKESLARGVPPISFGVLAPPEAGIVTGYDQSGDVLYGWSYFQPDGRRYYEKSDWFETMAFGDFKGWIVIEGKKSVLPPKREVLKPRWNGHSSWSAAAAVRKLQTMFVGWPHMMDGRIVWRRILITRQTTPK